MRKKIAYILLAIYSIVFAHNVIPHHHHDELLVNLSFTLECEDNHRHSHNEHIHNIGNTFYSDVEHVDHIHCEEQHSACYFDVRPVPGKSLSILPFITVNSYLQIKIPVRELTTQEFVYCPQKRLESYNFAVPLRAPPVFS